MSECFLYTCDVSSDFVLQCRVVCVAITGIPMKRKLIGPGGLTRVFLSV